MGGSNPYVKTPKTELPTRKYKISFESAQGGEPLVVEVDPAKIPFGATGLAGSVLDIALNHDIDIDHACGGVVACSTCHVYVKQGMSTCSEAEESEMDMLDMAPDLRPSSRLACQCVPNGEQDIVVEIPSWNRNLVREGK